MALAGWLAWFGAGGAALGGETAEGTPDWGARLEAVQADTGAPAMGLLAVDADKVLILEVIGERSLKSGVAVEPGDVWHLGSNGKAMTAVLAARLVEQGRLSWEDNLHDALAGAVEGVDPGWRAVTMEHLLSHSAGMRPNASMLSMIAMSGTDAERDARADRLDALKAVLAKPPASTPGTQFRYSNMGYVAAGAMIEARTGERWEVLMKQEVFEPLGMASAGFGAPRAGPGIAQPVGHRGGLFGGLSPAPEPDADNPPFYGPAGRIHMSLHDYGLFLRDQLRGAAGRSDALLRPESYERLHAPAIAAGGEDAYALGWGVNKAGIRGHSGSNTMWLVIARMDLERGLAVAAASNDGRLGRREKAMRALLDEAMTSAAEPRPAP